MFANFWIVCTERRIISLYDPLYHTCHEGQGIMNEQIARCYGWRSVCR